jgi:hypothetical protein
MYFRSVVVASRWPITWASTVELRPRWIMIEAEVCCHTPWKVEPFVEQPADQVFGILSSRPV